jgi:hypothetical protein
MKLFSEVGSPTWEALVAAVEAHPNAAALTAMLREAERDDLDALLRLFVQAVDGRPDA